MERSIDPALPRRAVLAAAAGGGALLVAKAALGPSPLLADTSGGNPTVFGFRFMIPPGTTNATFDTGQSVNGSTVVVCSLISRGRSTITHVSQDPDTNSFTVHLNRASRVDQEVGCVMTTEGGEISGPVSPPLSG